MGSREKPTVAIEGTFTSREMFFSPTSTPNSGSYYVDNGDGHAPVYTGIFVKDINQNKMAPSPLPPGSKSEPSKNPPENREGFFRLYSQTAACGPPCSFHRYEGFPGSGRPRQLPDLETHPALRKLHR